MSDTGRSEDIKQIHQEMERTKDPGVRESLRRTISNIKNESGAIRSMRESLVREHRNGNVENIKDIHDFIKRNSKYQNG